MKKGFLAWVAVASAVLLSSCGGGQDDSDESVTIYGPCGNSPNYSSNTVTTRWRHLPIKVAVDVTSAPRVNEGDNANIYARNIQRGALAWSNATGLNAVVFVMPSEADVIIRFSPSLPNRDLGRATYDRGSRYNAKGAFIEINAQEYAGFVGTSIFEGMIYQVAMHEIGHILFLRDHSPFAGDVMSGVSQGSTVSARDANTMREAYCRAL